MAILRDPRLLYLKVVLFLLLGAMAGLILFLDMPTARCVILLAVAVWAFSRAYYFAFYVVQHYIDPSYRFAGLIDFARYVLRKGRT